MYVKFLHFIHDLKDFIGHAAYIRVFSRGKNRRGDGAQVAVVESDFPV